MSNADLAAMNEVSVDEISAQLQTQFVWAPSFNVVHSHFDQAVRIGAITGRDVNQVENLLDKAARDHRRGQDDQAVDKLHRVLDKLDGGPGQTLLIDAINDLIGTLS
jgi:hypothetical protein